MPVRAARDPAAEWRAWWQAADAELGSEYGFLAATGLTWLGEDPVPVPGLPGRWSVSGGEAYVELAAGEELAIGGARVAPGASTRYPVPTVRAGEASPVRHGRIQVEVVAREEGVFVRPRDPEWWRRQSFTGTPAFDYDPGWRLAGEFFPAAGPAQTLALPSVMRGLTNRYGYAGTVALPIEGQPWTLDAVHHRTPGTARIIFRDPTNGVTTYRSGRYVDVELPAGGAGRVVVDFNRARPFPCSYTDSPTCPTAPPRNLLRVEVQAGARTHEGDIP